jgi:hypothetical protein
LQPKGSRCSRNLRLTRVVALCLVFVLLPPSSSFSQSQPDVSQLKAAFVYHFAQMVDWPPSYLDSNGSLVICSIDDDSYSAALDRAVDGKRIANHPVQTRHVRDLTTLHGCHVLALAAMEQSRLAAILDRVKNEPVLTVGDGDDFVAHGGIIGLAFQDKKIRFDINLNAAQRVNLKISSRLLLLARNVIGAGKQG